MERSEQFFGRVLDSRFRIDRLIGSGGMADVYLATDLVAEREVAVKILKSEISREEAAIKRFVNEAKVISMLSHKNIVSTFGVSLKGKLKYIVMEYVHGITLKNYMKKKGTLSVSEILCYTEQILEALEYASSKGIVHRDIKPQNIMLLKNGFIKVTDFGIAKLPTSETITLPDKAIGTVYYISPEQAKGGKIDVRSDLYSLGIMMYEMATGKLPFVSESPVSVAMMQINKAAVAPRKLNPELPIGLEQIINIAIKKDPRDRFQSAAQMLSYIHKFKRNDRIVFHPTQMKRKRPLFARLGARLQGWLERRRQSRKTREPINPYAVAIGALSAALITTLVAGGLIIGGLIRTKDHVSTLAVPNLVGQRYTEELAEYLTESEYFLFSDASVLYLYNADAPVGTVLSQSPAPDTELPLEEGQKHALTLTVSAGDKDSVMPNLRYLSYETAAEHLRKEGILHTVKEVYDDVIPKGHVCRASVSAGDTVLYGTEVTVYVSLGPQALSVPALISLTEAEAARQIASHGFVLGEVTYVTSESPVGTVISQGVDAYTSAPKYSKIDLVISLGAD
ncbi:MAG: Stk1 family PASTA domain-containing Ser/Thr kinase [Clostridia bacterium]|nr:Stk1 family PASTA domain-containing Ser/Thr kinase [Clostridia bacterium]